MFATSIDEDFNLLSEEPLDTSDGEI